MRRKSVVIALVLMALLVTPSVASAAPAQRWGGYCHWVQVGENVYRIGLQYGVSPWSIAAANGLTNLNYIRAGDCLVIPGGYSPSPYPYPYGCPYGHRVAPGENLYRIGLRYGASMWSIARANGLYNLNVIYAGQCLYIPSW